MTNLHHQVASARGDLPRADTKAQVVAGAIGALAIAVAPHVQQLTGAGIAAAGIAGIASAVTITAAGVALWPKRDPADDVDIVPPKTELVRVRRLLRRKFAAIRIAYTAAAPAAIGGITSLAFTQ